MTQNKWISVVLAVSLFSASILVTPKRAEAAAGLLSLQFGVGVPLAVAGGVGIAAGLTLVATCQDGLSCFGSNLLGAILLIVGVAMLDDEMGPDVSFAALSSDDGSKLGLTGIQIASYNRELLEINAIRDSIRSETVIQLSAGKQVDAESIHRLWLENSALISPEAFSALEKVSAQIAVAASHP